MDKMKTSICLTDDELLLLDGRCLPETQTIIDSVKERNYLSNTCSLTESQSKVIVDIVTCARSRGAVDFRWTAISGWQSCQVCGKRAGYSLFKTGMNKGKENTKKPWYIYGAKIGSEFICNDCYKALKPVIVRHLALIQCELAMELMSEGAAKMVKSVACKCNKCEWTGHEHQILAKMCLMGRGYYPGKCPGCGAEKTPIFSFNDVFTYDYGSWVIVPLSEHIVKSMNDKVRV